MDKTNRYTNTVDRPSISRTGREGTTLVEVLMAVVIISIMAAAIYSGGFAVLRHAQSVTIVTAANLYAKEGLEEVVATGYDTLSGGSPVEQVTMVNPETHHVDLVRNIDVIWHEPDGSTNSVPVEGGYAEVIARVSWQVPRSSNTASVALSSLLH